MPRSTDTIAALATPVGTAAIAVVRASGPDAGKWVREIFGAVPPPRQARHADYRDRTGQLLDDVLVTFFAGPHSYTGEDAFEVSCHGNPFIAQKILEDILARGGRSAEAGEFTQRAFLNGRMDLSQAEAVMDLIHARSERALAAAHQQLRGALGRQMEALIQRLLVVLAQVEAYIDFPDEDLPIEDQRVLAAEVDRLAIATDRLLATSHYGALLRDGIKTVIVGAPNAGKSSLLNRLVGSDRALVSAEPGTTRDYIEERIMLGPHGLRIIDTAGLNPSPTPLEKLGMDKTLERLRDADLYLLVFDASRPRPPLAPEVREILEKKPGIVIWNKIDLVPEASAKEDVNGGRNVGVSALTGFGWEALVDAITCVADDFQPHVGSELVAINARHAQALERARTGLAAAATSIRQAEPVELLASELRGTLAAYGEIAGQVDNERMLDQLFANFCIGK